MNVVRGSLCEIEKRVLGGKREGRRTIIPLGKYQCPLLSCSVIVDVMLEGSYHISLCFDTDVREDSVEHNVPVPWKNYEY